MGLSANREAFQITPPTEDSQDLSVGRLKEAFCKTSHKAGGPVLLKTVTSIWFGPGFSHLAIRSLMASFQ